MKYDITYTCGHMGTVEVEGSTSQIESKLNWYKTKAICPICYKAQKDEERAHQPRILNVLPSSEIDETKREAKTLMWVTGYALPIKDKFKEVGFHWGMLNDIQVLHTTDAPRVWYIEGAYSEMRELAKHLRDSGCVEGVNNYENTALGKQNKQAASAKLGIVTQNFGLEPTADAEPVGAGTPFMQGVMQNGETAAMFPCAPLEQPYCVKGKQWDGYVYCTKQFSYVMVDGRQYNLTDADVQDFKNYAVAMQNCGMMLLRQFNERK